MCKPARSIDFTVREEILSQSWWVKGVIDFPLVEPLCEGADSERGGWDCIMLV